MQSHATHIVGNQQDSCQPGSRISQHFNKLSRLCSVLLLASLSLPALAADQTHATPKVTHQSVLNAYAKTPALWRTYRDKSDEYRSIGISQAILAISSLLFIIVCSGLGLVSAKSAFLTAATLWVMIPVPLLATNAIFLPMDRLIVVSHSLGWLARLLVTAAFVSWLL